MKSLKQALFVVITLGFLSAAFADQITLPTNPKADCVPQSEMQVIAKQFSQFAPYANADYCYDNSQISNLINSIMFMRGTTFSANMGTSQDELFSGRFSKSWWDYFIGRIDNLQVENSCPKGVVAFVYAFGDHTMHVCPMALTEQFSSLDRASVMMHEARHIDGFPHMTCSHGARQGLSGACDSKISDGGSYAVTVETYAQLAKYANDLHPALKAYARAAAVIYADEAFENQVRITRTENLLMLTSTLDFNALNLQTNQITKLGQASTAGHIVRRSQHMILIPDDKSKKAEYVFARNEGQIPQSPSDLITEYNGQTPADKAKLVDLHIGAQWNARVYQTGIRFVCDPTSPAITDMQLPAGQVAANLIYPTGYDRAASTANLVTQSGDILDISCAGRKASITASTTKLDQKYKRVYKTANQVFGLTAAGQLFKLDGGKSTPVATAFDGNIIEIIPQQTFQFFDVR